jgi:hypothetical protein
LIHIASRPLPIDSCKAATLLCTGLQAIPKPFPSFDRFSSIPLLQNVDVINADIINDTQAPIALAIKAFTRITQIA